MVVDDQVKLSPDFGWRSRTRSIYDAPETGTIYVAPAADIWSLGILLVEALTQQPPAWDRSRGGAPEIPATIPEPFFTICRECLRIDPERRCTLGGIKAHLNSPLAAEPAAPSAEAIVERAAKPSYKFRAKIVAGAIVVLLLTLGAFTFGWNLTPSPPAPAPQPPVQELNAVTTAQPRVQEFTAAPAPQPRATEPTAAPVLPAATIPAPSRVPTAEPAPAPAPAPVVAPAPASAPAAEPSIGGVVKGSATHQALPDIPGKILGAVHGHFQVQIRVEVDPEGNVSQAAIDLPGPSRYFANQALTAAQNWKFTPAMVDGRAVASAWLLLFQFSQAQSAVTPSEETP